jgi:hypothetical protein
MCESRRLMSRCVAGGIDATRHERPLNRMIASWKPTEHCIIGAGLQGKRLAYKRGRPGTSGTRTLSGRSGLQLSKSTIADAEVKRLTRHPREAVAPAALEGLSNSMARAFSASTGDFRIPRKTSLTRGVVHRRGPGGTPPSSPRSHGERKPGSRRHHRSFVTPCLPRHLNWCVDRSLDRERRSSYPQLHRPVK